MWVLPWGWLFRLFRIKSPPLKMTNVASRGGRVQRGDRIGVDSAATCSISIAIWPQVLLVGGGGGDLHSMGDATLDPDRHLSWRNALCIAVDRTRVYQEIRDLETFQSQIKSPWFTSYHSRKGRLQGNGFRRNILKPPIEEGNEFRARASGDRGAPVSPLLLVLRGSDKSRGIIIDCGHSVVMWGREREGKRVSSGADPTLCQAHSYPCRCTYLTILYPSPAHVS